MKRFLLLFLLGISIHVVANPFAIPTSSNYQELTNNQYQEIQNKLQIIEINTCIEAIYPRNIFSFLKGSWKIRQSKEDFILRCSCGTRQVMIDPIKNKFPTKTLHKINEGSSFCIVSFASFNGRYESLLQTIRSSLESTGFNGYFLEICGGYPNPSGEEIAYCAVPYAFKIFAMLEAKKLGFAKVLWIDSSLQPLKDPTPLFEWIELSGSLFHKCKNASRYLLPATRDILLQETGVDMYKEKSIRAQVIGLDFSIKKVENLVADYYKLVKIGTPFLSCFPEEFVLGALIHQNPALWPSHPFGKLTKAERKLNKKQQSKKIEIDRFFLLRTH